ncbi:MAG: DUF3082 domain-containing protein [Limnospira sp. PMC 1291.21]|uniref:DUF3082 domain-containing protein n=3 Tax=Limnospira TaxID=2596745 RepID=A0A9P1KBQ4_9CYAN|nr:MULTISPECIES: DUF3082 domain-containing protein [Limnospira]EKD10932.1 hypothetical protein SPLC1_S051400 [Arthrospira platensis C1]MBD2670752.1 DUF3082 domain-containing protein [Arthrospira platensis FACHB-439]MDC0836546.1 DUF3082 domain-containing protein [Limnoraphis robusta]MDY7054605.1 DUF3082 domain-containing protein [Limnospira fusiformis LS22]QJB27977.1 DUF3082 domain-containing protein [Limnospira fusiformis SAG 85.79]
MSDLPEKSSISTSDSGDQSRRDLSPDLSSVNPFQVLMGGLFSGGFAIAMYSLTAAIAHTFANQNIYSDNRTALQISIAIRTLVIGGAALVTGIFTIASLGLLALTVQVLFVRLTQKNSASEK